MAGPSDVMDVCPEATSTTPTPSGSLDEADRAVFEAEVRVAASEGAAVSRIALASALMNVARLRAAQGDAHGAARDQVRASALLEALPVEEAARVRSELRCTATLPPPGAPVVSYRVLEEEGEEEKAREEEERSSSSSEESSGEAQVRHEAHVQALARHEYEAALRLRPHDAHLRARYQRFLRREGLVPGQPDDLSEEQEAAGKRARVE